MKSFISEHTAEYYLVPKFKAILESDFSAALPFYFWSSREGNNTSLEMELTEPAAVCALFPRRSKIDARDVFMKVNGDVLSQASYLSSEGIPCFCGIPEVTSFLGFANTYACDWFFLNPNAAEPADVILQIGTGISTTDAVFGPLPEKAVVDLIRSNSRRRLWEETVNSLRELKTHLPYYRFMFGATYKPVFFLLIEQVGQFPRDAIALG